MKLSEKLRTMHGNVYLNLNRTARQDLLQAADLLDATTPRPWPPPEGVKECFAWRKRRGWFAVKNAAAHRLLPPEFQPEWWMPMPPEPEVDRG